MTRRNRRWEQHGAAQWASALHAPMLLAIAFVYLSAATGHTWVLDPAPLRAWDYFTTQAEAFAQGRVELGLSRGLLDMSEYDGRVYLYWGPGNALPHLLWRLVTPAPLSISLWTFLFSLGGVVAFAFTMRELRDRWIPGTPRWVSLCFLTTLALGSPVFVITASVVVPHHQSIALSFLAQSVTLLLYTRMLRRFSWRTAALLGLAMGFGVTVRLMALFLIPGLAAGALLLSPSPRLREFAKRAALPALFVGLTVGGLMLFNASRFGDPFETGMRYATGEIEQRNHLYAMGVLISPRWISFNFWAYFLRLPSFAGLWPRIPWTETIEVPPSIRDLYIPAMPLSVDTQSVVFMTPPLLFVLLLALRPPQAPARALGLGFAMAAAGAIAFLLCYSALARRFVVDFLAAWLLAASVGVMGSLSAHPKAERWMRVALIAATLWSVMVHWHLAQVGARKVNAALMLAEAAGMSNPVWEPVCACVLGLGLLADLWLARRLREAAAAQTQLP